MPIPDADCRVGRDSNYDVLVGFHLDLSLLLGQFHFFRERILVPNLDGPVSEPANDGVVAYFDVVDVVRALEGRLPCGRRKASMPS